MKKLLLAVAVIFSSSLANAEQILNIDFDKAINKQFAGDSYTTWVEGGVQISQPERGIKHIVIEVSGFDSNGDTYASGGFMIVSNDMPDVNTCHKMSAEVKSKMPKNIDFASYMMKDEFGCEKGYENQWYYIIGGKLIQ